MIKANQAIAILFVSAIEVSSANGQDCSDFNKAMDATRAANAGMDAELTRIKAMGQPPRFDVDACKVAKQLKDQAGDATKLANSSCGSDSEVVVGALGDIIQSAEKEITLYCVPEVDTSASTAPSVIRDSGFIFPDSDQRFLTVNDLRGLSSEQLRVARNEIFARRGRYFKDQALTAHFSQFSWYQPDRWDVTLNNFEQANIKLIQSMER
jgi:hypothetical protein